MFTWQVWNGKRIIDPTTAFGMTKWKGRKLCHLDASSDSGCVMGLEVWNSERTTDPTTAFGMTKWRESTICLPGKIGMESVL